MTAPSSILDRASTEFKGVVAKPRRSRYVSGERGWIKTKNRDYWRYEMERESAAAKIKIQRQFV